MQLFSNYLLVVFADFISFFFQIQSLCYFCIFFVKNHPELSTFYSNLRAHKRSRGRFPILTIKSIDSSFKFWNHVESITSIVVPVVASMPKETPTIMTTSFIRQHI